MYNFKRLINKYSKHPVYTLIETEGYRDINNGGIWVDGEIIEMLVEDAAIVPLNKDELHYDDGGTYTSNDRKLYCYSELKEGTKIKHKEREYTIQESTDYSDFDNQLNIYIIKAGGND